jgi:pimeloyl-ACP methyl ester carboxylesterase
VIQPLFEYRKTFAGYETRVLELEGDGVPLLLLHGYADSADTWRQVLALLARQGRATIAVDLPGFGTADPLRPEPILPQLDAFAAEALVYAGGRPRQPVMVVGNSLGGCMALRLAERKGERLAGVVAAAPAGFQMSRIVALVERDPLLRSLLTLPAPVPAAILRAAVGRLYRAIALSSPRAVRWSRRSPTITARGKPWPGIWPSRTGSCPSCARPMSWRASTVRCSSSGATTTGCCFMPARRRSSTRCPVHASSCCRGSATAHRSRPRAG